MTGAPPVRSHWLRGPLLAAQGAAARPRPDRAKPDLDIAPGDRERSGGDPDPVTKPPGLRRGDRVRITSGPFSDHLALYQGQASHDRVAVLLQLLGGQQRAELAANAIEPVGAPVMTRLPEGNLLRGSGPARAGAPADLYREGREHSRRLLTILRAWAWRCRPRGSRRVRGAVGAAASRRGEERFAVELRDASVRAGLEASLLTGGSESERVSSRGFFHLHYALRRASGTTVVVPRPAMIAASRSPHSSIACAFSAA